MTEYLDQIEIGKLDLDDQNPRLPKYLRGKDEATIIEYMLLEASTLDLMLAIGQNGFFPGEPLLVVAEGERFRVVEGNRRLTALKLLKNPDLAPVQKQRVSQIMEAVTYKEEHVERVPCQIFEDPDRIHRYLGYRHITGVQSWDLTQKAAFLTSIREQEYPDLAVDDASRELAKMIGSRRDYVKRLLVGYGVFQVIKDNAFFKVKGLDESSFYFNYIADCLRQEKIADFIGIDMDSETPEETLDVENLTIWVKWFFEKGSQNNTRIKATALELKMLNAVLSNSRALVAFKDDMKSLKEAYELTGEVEEVFQGAIAKAVSALETADGLTHRLEHVYGGLSGDLQAIRRLANKIRNATEENLDDDA